MFKRVTLYLATNLAVLVILGTLVLVLERLGLLGDYGAAGYVPLLIMSVLWGFGGSLISLLLSKFIAKRSTGAHVITQPRNQDEAWLLATVQAQAQRAGIGMPEVAVYGSHQPNAFATGASRNSALVAVSTGLLGSMSRDEVEAVLAHEVSHVANGDMVTLSLIQGVLNTFVIFASRIIGQIVDRAVFRSRRGYGPGYWVTVILMQVVLGLLATIVVMWFSRVREYRADEGAARLAGPQKMVSALRRLQQAHEPADLPESMEAMGIRSGPKRGLRALFASHPPLEQRIAKLVADSQSGAFG